MKTKQITIALAALTCATALFFTSCKKDKEEEDKDTAAASDHSYAENLSNDIMNIGGQGLDNSGNTLSTYKMGGTPTEAFMLTCANVTVDTATKKVTVAFQNTTCNDGRVRNGSLIFDYSQSTNGAKHYRTPGFKCIVTSNGYTVDGNQVNIVNKTIENTTPVGFNPSTTNITWNISANINIVKTDGSTITWSCSRTKRLLNTSDTLVYINDAYPINWTKARIGITGSANGVTAAGNSYTATVTSELIRDFTCGFGTYGHRHPFIQGTIKFSPSGKQDRIIDFGNGACDLIGTITIGNYSASFNM